MHQLKTKYKRPFVTIVIIFFALSLKAQKLELKQPDSLTPKSLELYRSVFWNNIPKPLNWTNDYENIYTDEEQNENHYTEAEISTTDATDQTVMLKFVVDNFDVSGEIKVTKKDKLKKKFEFIGKEKATKKK